MTRVEQERLVGSYLRGEMTAGQEQEFFIQVALDSDLRQTLKAFRVVENAIQKHRQAISSNHAESYNRLMGMLTASAPEQVGLVGTSAAGLLRQGVGVFGARVFTWTTAIVATAALTVGAFILGPALNQADETDMPQQKASSGLQGTSSVVDPAPVAGERAVSGIERQPESGITLGTAHDVAPSIAEEGRNATKKSPSSVEAAGIVDRGQKNGPIRTGENDGLLSNEPDPILSLLNQSDDGSTSISPASPTSTKKGGVKIVYNWPQIQDQSKSDTIQFRVHVERDGIKKPK